MYELGMAGEQKSVPPFSITIVGFGRLGSTIAASFGSTVQAVVVRSEEAAERAAASGLLSESTRLLTDLQHLDRVEEPGLVWIATQDRFLPEICRAIGQLNVEQADGVIHSSGATGLSVFESLRGEQPGLQCAVAHPNTILTRGNRFEPDLVWGVSGDQRLLVQIGRMLEPFTPVLVDVSDHDRGLYHAAATLVANYPMVLMEAARQLYDSIGIPESIQQKLVSEYVRRALEQFTSTGFEQGLTGPAVRGDLQVLKQHLDDVALVDGVIAELLVALIQSTLARFHPELVERIRSGENRRDRGDRLG